LLKKTTEVIVESENNYVIGVKCNQPKLYEQISKTTSDKSKISSISEISMDRIKNDYKSRKNC